MLEQSRASFDLMALIFRNISQGIDLGLVDQYSSSEHHIYTYVRKNV